MYICTQKENIFLLICISFFILQQISESHYVFNYPYTITILKKDYLLKLQHLKTTQTGQSIKYLHIKLCTHFKETNYATKNTNMRIN